MEILYIVLAVVGIVFVLRFVRFIVRTRRVTRYADDWIARWCHQMGMPNVEFDVKAAVREVIAGTRPGIPRDGQWWVALGIEYASYPARTRLHAEGPLPDVNAVQQAIRDMLDEYGGPAQLPPHGAETYAIAPVPGMPRDTVWARVTGRYRPIGAWIVAVPPHLIGSGRRK